MAQPIVKRFAETVSCFCFNADKSKMALCPNNNVIIIYAKNGGDWVEEHTLTEHTELVTGLDWGNKTNRLVSCSQDRNAYVWTLDGNKWKPSLVILRLQRAATFVKWSPKEDKFAVSTGAKLTCICYFEEENDWWVSKHIKKHKSTVSAVQWHPQNTLVATGSSDGFVRVSSAWTKGVDKKGTPVPLPDPEKQSENFGESLYEYDCGSWVKDVAWSPSGNLLAFTSQDSCIYVADVTKGQVAPAICKLPGLPLTRIAFTSEAQIVGVGYDCEPYVFQAGSGMIKKIKSLDGQQNAQTGQTSNLKMWQNMDKKGQSENVEQLKTKHQNAITWLEDGGQGQVVTGGLDGNLIWWKY